MYFVKKENFRPPSFILPLPRGGWEGLIKEGKEDGFMHETRDRGI
jgi:hypothetical protein